MKTRKANGPIHRIRIPHDTWLALTCWCKVSGETISEALDSALREFIAIRTIGDTLGCEEHGEDL